MPKRKRLDIEDLGGDSVRHLPPHLKAVWRQRAYDRHRGRVMDDSMLGAYLDGFLCGRLGLSRSWNPFDDGYGKRVWRMGWDFARGMCRDDRALEARLGEVVRAWELEEYNMDGDVP